MVGSIRNYMTMEQWGDASHLERGVGSGTVSSSDGQRFGIQRSSLLASFYPRYFGYYDRAVSVYTHVSDQFSVFPTRVISCAPREALYVLDGLLENDSALRLSPPSCFPLWPEAPVLR
jgi:TnpA family transposase